MDPAHPDLNMTLCVDYDEQSPALQYGWVKSKQLTTAFSSEKDAYQRGVDRCGIGEFLKGVRIIHILPHPDPKKLHLKSLPKLKL
jgi:hypothetical protein